MLIFPWAFNLSDLQESKMDLEEAGRVNFRTGHLAQQWSATGEEPLGGRLAMKGFSRSLFSYSDSFPRYCGSVTKLKLLKLEYGMKPTKNCPGKWLAPLKSYIHTSQARGKCISFKTNCTMALRYLTQIKYIWQLSSWCYQADSYYCKYS